jgi:hypothetical protein
MSNLLQRTRAGARALIVCSCLAGSIPAFPGQLFFDDFTRTSDPGPLSPWVAQTGTWTVTGGILLGGTNAPQTYGYVLLTNSWTNFSVEASIRFPTGAYGGGLGGRLNPVTGAHYAAWIYPEGSSAGGSSLRLVKFQNWTYWGYGGNQYTPMQMVALPGVGTNWHTLKLTFQDRLITVFYDGAQVISATDLEPQSFPSGGISAEMWTDTTPYNMAVDFVTVTTTATAPLPPPEPIGILADANSATVRVTFSGAAGSQYLVQTTSNLIPPVLWSSIATNTAGTNGLWSFADSLTNGPQRFYRAAVPGS